MPVKVIDTSPEAFSVQSTVLDGVEYLLRFQYNQRAACYYLSIGDPASGADLLSGVKLVSNWYLIRRYAGMGGLPPGELVAFSNTPDDSPADIGQLGPNARVTLLYLDKQFLTSGT